jgi:hypothetical protein
LNTQLNDLIGILPFIPLTVFKEITALDPFSTYPNPGGVGGTEWKRSTEIASDIFERCPGREWIRNVTKYANTWKCKSLISCCPRLKLIYEKIDGMP